jgi:hypothetical protein
MAGLVARYALRKSKGGATPGFHYVRLARRAQA